MQHLRFKQLLVLSNSAKSGNQFLFKRLNLIIANDNSVGKSTLAKLLFWSLGCEPDLDTTWRNFDCSTIITFTVGDEQYEIKRYKNEISLKDKSSITTYPKITGDYATRLSEIVNFKALLPNQHSGELETPPPAFYFLPFYIDQKRSWSKAWDNFNNLGQYRSWKKNIIKYHVGILTPTYFDFEIEKSIKKNNKNEINVEVEKINSTLEIVENHISTENFTAISQEEFEVMTSEIERDLEELTIQQEEVLADYADLQSTKSHLEHQKSMAKALVQELDKDYVFAVERIEGDTIDCPICGTSHDNSIFNKASILKDKVQAEAQFDSISKEVIRVDKKIVITRMQLDDIKNKIQSLDEKYSVGEKQQQSFSNLVVNIGGNAFKRNVIESRNQKMSMIAELDRSIKLANKSQKNLYKKEDIEDINASFNSYLSSYIKELDAKAVNLSKIDSPLSYNYIVSEGGAAENSRAILAYYLAIFSTVVKHGNEVISPLVIDTPNQQEQSENNYQNIVNLILDKIPNDKQVVVCAMENDKLHSFKEKANIIELDAGKLLDSTKFEEVQKLFTIWENHSDDLNDN